MKKKKGVKAYKKHKSPKIHLDHSKHSESHHKIKKEIHLDFKSHTYMLLTILIISIIIFLGTFIYIYSLSKMFS